jgi:hypothetical protein
MRGVCYGVLLYLYVLLVAAFVTQPVGYKKQLQGSGNVSHRQQQHQ